MLIAGHSYSFIVFLVICAAVYGLGATRLMYWLLDLVLTRLPSNALLVNVGVVLGWFVGGGALMLGALHAGDVRRSLDASEAFGVAILSYLGGFGVGLLLIEKWSKPSLIRDLKKYLSDEELEAVLLILKYSVSPEQAATTLGVSPGRLILVYKNALKKLNDRARSLIKALERRTEMESQTSFIRAAELDNRDHVLECLKRMTSPVHRSLLNRVYNEGQSIDVAAEELHLSPDDAACMLLEAMRELRALCSQHVGDN